MAWFKWWNNKFFLVSKEITNPNEVSGISYREFMKDIIHKAYLLKRWKEKIQIDGKITECVNTFQITHILLLLTWLCPGIYCPFLILNFTMVRYDENSQGNVFTVEPRLLHTPSTSALLK